MNRMSRIASVTLAAGVVSGSWFPVASQSAGAARASGKPAAPQVCSLLSAAEIDRLVVRGQDTHGAPVERDSTSLGIADSACEFGGFGQIVLFSGAGSEQRFEAFLKRFKAEQEKRTPVSGVGDRSYIMFPKPRNEYQDRAAYLVTRTGPYTLGISLNARTSPLDGPMGPVLKASCTGYKLSRKEQASCVKVMAEKSETAESLQPAVVELAKVVVARLR